MSYMGQLNFGIVADREQMPDVWSLTGWLSEAVEELRTEPAPAQAPTATEPAPG